ncbi:DUF5606 domain-containing protein [Rapidithrix thailandica]|uniref:DUF5606 domain-containing protein n=1 Tax=Rapidithrix thailandica TaxID=413964 RepID=A0AAW9SAJ1_9BACT
MTLKDIAAVAGKPGLFKILKPTKSGVIVESLDKKKLKSVVNASQRVSILQEISVYTTTEEESVPLKQVLLSIREKHGDNVEVSTTDADALRAFIEEILPEYDQERVYTSDLKKLVNWFNILVEYVPEVLDPEPEEEEKEETQEEVSEKEEAAKK